MKKKTKIALAVLAALVLLIGLGLVWWFMPTHFLRGIEPGEVASIHVFNGNNGNSFDVTDPKDISFIVEHIQQTSFRKNEFSLMYLGSSYRMRFLAADGTELDHFVVNFYDIIRKDPIFYQCDGSMGVMEYMEHLESTKFPKQP